MIKYERTIVTPALARRWLELNAENNRLPRPRKIQAYARDMASGNWNSDSGETIKFDKNGILVDEQNRLKAVLLADMSIAMDVVTGLPESAMLVIDSGIARTGADAIRLSGAKGASSVSSIVRWSILWDAGYYMGNVSNKSGGPTNTEIDNRYRSEMGAYDSASQRAKDCQNRSLGTGAVAGLSFYLFSRIDREQTHAFFDQFISGANLSEGAAPLALRNKIARMRVDRLTRSEQLALFVRGWNAFRSGEKLQRMIISRGELTNLNFPQPK